MRVVCENRKRTNVVVLGSGTLALVNLDLNAGLVVGVSPEGTESARSRKIQCMKRTHEKVSDFLVGTVVLRGMSLVMTPPAVSVSIPIESGATSRRRRSCVFSEVSPVRMAAWTAAP